MKPVMMRIVVDFPAPFGPRKPSTSPRSTLNEMPSTARLGPKAFTRLSILIIRGAMCARPRRFKDVAYNRGRCAFSHTFQEQTHAHLKRIAGGARLCARAACAFATDAEDDDP